MSSKSYLTNPRGEKRTRKINVRQGRVLKQLIKHFGLGDPTTMKLPGSILFLRDLYLEICQEYSKQDRLSQNSCYELVNIVLDDSLTFKRLPTNLLGWEKELRSIRENFEAIEMPYPGRRARKAIRSLPTEDDEYTSWWDKTCESCVFFNHVLLHCNFIQWMMHEKKKRAADQARVIERFLQGIGGMYGRLGDDTPACSIYQGDEDIIPSQVLKQVNREFLCPHPKCKGTLERLPLPGKGISCDKCGRETVFNPSTVTPYITRVNAGIVFRKKVKKFTGIVLDQLKSPDYKYSLHLTLSESQQPKLIFPGNIPHLVYNDRGKKRQKPLHDIVTITISEQSTIPAKLRKSLREYREKHSNESVPRPRRPVKWRLLPSSGVVITRRKTSLKDILSQEKIRATLTKKYYHGLVAFLGKFPEWWQAITGDTSSFKENEIPVRKKRETSSLARKLRNLQKRAKLSGQDRENQMNNLIVPFLKEKAVKMCNTARMFETSGLKLVTMETSQARLRYVKSEYEGSFARAHDCFTCLLNGITWHVRNSLMEINLLQGLDPEVTWLFFHKPSKHPQLGPHLDLEEYGRTLVKIHEVKAMSEGLIEPGMFREEWDPRAGIYYRLHHLETVKSIAKKVLKTKIKWKEGKKEFINTFENFHARYVSAMLNPLHDADGQPEKVNLSSVKGLVPLPAVMD
ncbi:MAG: hypothetical protein ACXAEU_11510 [Candidatus Hodarchaeales archaeon]|jgi:hypothetical protein